MTEIELECRLAWFYASIGATDTSAVELECRRAWWAADGWHQIRKAQNAMIEAHIAAYSKPRLVLVPDDEWQCRRRWWWW